MSSSSNNFLTEYQQRKEQRRKAYFQTHGVKMVVCGACSGSGYYDNKGSPKCGACGGKGKHFP